MRKDFFIFGGVNSLDYGVLLDGSGTTTAPERDVMTVTVASEDECEEVSSILLTGRAGLLAWYVENVGYSPDEDIGGLTPIDDLIDRVASHILLRTHESVVSS